MRHTILLISKDKRLSESRAQLLERAGYRALSASTLTGAIGLMTYGDLALIDRTFQTEEHEEFAACVQASRAKLIVLSLRAALIKPEILMMAVTDCLTTHVGECKVVIIDDPDAPPCQSES